MNKCVFLDRDGTINVDHGYTYLPSDLVFMPDVPQALKLLKNKGFLLIVITNQSGIAKGKYTVCDMNRFHQEINTQLMEQTGIKIDAFYFCPHHPLGIVKPYNRVCSCRKPEPELIYRASSAFDIDLSASYMIGDKDCDITLGKRVGMKGVFRITPTITMLKLVSEIN